MAAIVGSLVFTHGLQLSRTPFSRSNAIRMKGAAPYDYTFISLLPTYVIKDWAAAQPLVDAYLAEAKAKDAGAIMYAGYDTTRSQTDMDTVGGLATVGGDRLCLRLAFNEADGLASHVVALLRPLHDRLQAAVTLEEVQVHGPAAALASCKRAVEQSLSGSTVSSYAIKLGMSRIEKEVGGMSLPMQLLSVHTSFELHDAEAAMLLLDAIVQRSKTEDNCLYTGWTRSGDTLVLREAFGSVNGIARHVENIGEQLQVLTAGPKPAATFLETRLHTALGNLQIFDDYCTDAKREVGYCSRATRRYHLGRVAFRATRCSSPCLGSFFGANGYTVHGVGNDVSAPHTTKGEDARLHVAEERRSNACVRKGPVRTG